MRDSRHTGSDRNVSTEPSSFVNYLPGMPRLSTVPGRTERLLTRLFRRRGRFGLDLRRED